MKEAFLPSVGGDARAEAVHRTIHDFMYTDRLHRAAIERAISTLGIHRSQHRMLVHLWRAGGELSQGALAKELDISPAAVAVTLGKLERAGYIRRVSDSADGRRKTIAVTPEGEELLRVSRSAFDEVDLAMFSALSDEELTLLSSILGRLQRTLKEKNLSGEVAE